MGYGIALFPQPGCATLVRRAEELGFRTAWFYDTQMLAADVFIAMALAARETSRIRLGTGVLVPSNRIAPVAASAFGTLNALAPGRVVCGIGTGFTARNTMGQGPVPLAALQAYIRVVRGILAGETVEWHAEDGSHLVRFLHPGRGFIEQEAPLPIHISAFGPKGQALAAGLGDGWITFFGNQDRALAQAKDVDARVRAAGRDPAAFEKVAFTLGCVLAEGEPHDSPRAMAQAGPLAAVGWHGAMEQWDRLPERVRESLAPMRAIYERYEPAAAPYLRLHTGHLCFVREEERDFAAAAIPASTFTGTRAALRDRLRAFAAAGYTEFVVQLVPGHEDALEEWADLFALI